MNTELYRQATHIIACTETLLGEHDGQLSDKQRKVVKTILANAERFIHVYAECLEMTTGDFVATMRHEIGTPLTPILGYSELLLMGALGDLNEQQQAAVQGIFESTDQLQAGVEVMVQEARRKLESMPEIP